MSSRVRDYTPEKYLPQFDKYNKDDDFTATKPKRASTVPVDYDDYDRSHGRYKSNTSARRRNSVSHALQKRTSPGPLEKKDAESDWDTDYDPRDRLYLSADESDSEDDRRYSSRDRRDGSRRESSRRHSERHGDRHRDRSRDRDHGSARRSSYSHHDDHRHSSTSSSRGDGRRHSTSETSSRPRTYRANSGRTSRSHGSRYPPSSSRATAHPKPASHRHHIPRGHSHEPALSVPMDEALAITLKNINWEQAARTALKVGTITAMKVASTNSSMIEKGAKVASTGLAAAMVDTMMSEKHQSIKGGVRHAALRHAAEIALGSMVIGPSLKGMGMKK